MDRDGQAPTAERLIANPTARLIADVLASIDSSTHAKWRDGLGDPNLPRVTANGLSVPIVRVPWNKVDDFFETLFAIANDRHFSSVLPRCRRVWNRRFRGLAGRIECRSKTIELSSAHFEQCGIGAMGIVLVHEMIHLALFTERRPHGHTGEFKRRSFSLGLPRIYHELPLPTRLVRPKRYVYACACGLRVESKIRFRAPRACASCCKKFNRGRFDRRFALFLVEDRQQVG